MTKHLSDFEKAIIINEIKNGSTYREISKKNNISIGAISKLMQKHKKGLAEGRKLGSGRREVLNSQIKNFIFMAQENDPNFTAAKCAGIIEEEFKLVVSAQTIRNLLSSEGFSTYSPTKKPLLLKRHKTIRSEIAKSWCFKPKGFWNDVIFSDESKFCLFNSDGRRFVWRKRGENLLDKNIKSTVKFGGGSIMVWGCFSSRGFGKLVLIDGIMDKYKYVDILNDGLMASVDMLGHENFIFQQDNDPKHTAKHTKEFFKARNIKTLQWPAQSPDLNPIENAWGLIKQKIANKTFRSKSELFNEVKAIWESFTVEYAQKLVKSMNKRVLECLRNNGGHTKY